jgi:hypothetical protein
MVNEEFKHELSQLFKQSLGEALPTGANGESWSISELSDNNEINLPEFFVLTISSQLFRVLIFLHFVKNTISEQYVADALGVNAASLEADKFYDFLGEIGNGFCGTIKRELCHTVPSLGMSTPNRLDRACLQYMTNLNVEFESHVKTEMENGPTFYSSLYLCADNDLNFQVARRASAEPETDSGDLEFF